MGVLNRNLARGVRPTQRNPDLVQDTNDVNFASLVSAVISYPVQDCNRHYRISHNTEFAFSHISTKAHEINENYVVEGGEMEKICGDGPV